MEPIIETGKNVITVISEPGALTFATRKEWEPLLENDFNKLKSHELLLTVKGKGSIFLLFRSIYSGAKYLTDDLISFFKLVKITMNEEGKQDCYIMYLSEAEFNQLQQNRLNLWD